MSDRIFEVLASAFLAAHPYVMADSSHLVSILQGCTPRELQEGEILCREGEPGVELYFLLRGVIRVQKAGPDGEPVFLGRVQAPALLGQMAILDRTRRSATCTAEGTALVVVMDQPRFAELIRSTGGEGHTLRRLLLSSLTRQLVKGNAHLRKVTATQIDEPSTTERELGRARASLEGWAGASEPPTAPLPTIAKD